MGSAKGIVDVEVERCGQLGDKGFFVLRLLLVEASVLQQEDVALLGGTDHLLDGITDAVGASLTSFLRSSPMRRAQGWRENLSSGPSLGRPRWEHTVTMAPLDTRYSMVGIERRMRVSSVMILPCFVFCDDKASI